MHIYPYWLDGVHRKLLLTGDASTDLHTPDRQAEWIIKWRALLPGSLVLAGPQIADHPLIWHLFRDSEFRHLLKESEPRSIGEEDHSFLRLVAPASCNSSRALKWDIAITPEKRIAEVGRFGTVFKDPRSALTLAERLTKAGPGGDFERIKQEFKDSPDSEAFEGKLNTIWYFAQPGAPTYAPQSKPAHFYTFLQQALESQLTDEERKMLEKTIELVIAAAENHPRGLALGRADVENTLDPRDPSHQAAWRTIVGSWNVAQQKTLGAKGYWGRLPNSVPIALHLTGAPLDGVLEAGPEKIAPRWPGFQKLYKWIYDPGFLDWGSIRELRGATEDERRKLEHAMNGRHEQTQEMLDRFADSVRRHMGKIKNPIPTSTKPVAWIGAMLYLLGIKIPIWPEITGSVALGTTISDAGVSLANYCRSRLIAATINEVAGKRLR